jgi:hypothetical protein
MITSTYTRAKKFPRAGDFFRASERELTAMRANFGSVFNSPFQNSLQEKRI